MAWHIPKNKMNNNPFSQEIAEQKFLKYGLKLIDKYINNRTRHHCIDSDGYYVMATLDSLGRVNKYARFSASANPDGFIYNSNKWLKENDINLSVIDWYYPEENSHKKLMVKCKCGECDGIFYTRWNSIKNGGVRQCPKCSFIMSNIARMVEQYLINNNIEYINEYRFEDCKDIKPLPFDFYLPHYNCCIEVDGEQHFYTDKNKIWYNGAIGDELDKIKKHDEIKNQYCKNNKIKLIRLKYDIIRNGKYKSVLKELLQG